MSGQGAKKKGGGVFTETDIFPELAENGQTPEAGSARTQEANHVLATFQAMALEQGMRKRDPNGGAAG